MPNIRVSSGEVTDASFSFDVEVGEGGDSSSHAVTLSREDYGRLRKGQEKPEELVRRCFEFLLEREPKESILRKFDVSVIGRYFPEFEQSIIK